jgi:monoterpene epsilon-lactone hydrolase
MAKNKRTARTSFRGIFLRELIARGIKASGVDILTFAKKYEKLTHTKWRPPRGWEFEKATLPDEANAWYMIPKNCVRQGVAILQLHGGGYTLGFLPLFKHFAIKLARLGGHVPVLSLDYRVAPEHPYPAALEDALHAIEWLKEKKGVAPESVVVVGESCGAGLALALAMRLRDKYRSSLKALVLMSPWADLTCRGDSYENRYHMDPFFGRKMPVPSDEYRTAIGKVYAGDNDLTDPYVSPAFGDFSCLPPMLIHVGDYEMLYDDAYAVYKKAAGAGVNVQFKAWPGMFHVFQLADGLLPESRAAWREIGSFLRRHLEDTGNDDLFDSVSG